MLTEATMAALAALANTVLQMQLAHFNALPEDQKLAQAVQLQQLAQPWIDIGLKIAGLLDKLMVSGKAGG